MKHTLRLTILISLTSFFGHSQLDFSTRLQVGTTGTNPQYIATGDINNDGYDDILVALRNTSTSETFTLQLFTNDYENSGTFIKTDITNTLQDIVGLAIGDINGDGFEDIVASGAANGRLAWYPNNQSGGFPTENIISASLIGPGTVVLADIDNSNTLDVLTADYDTGETLWFSNNGTGTFSSKNIIAVDATSGPVDLDVGDLDGDGDLDVAVGYYVTGTIEIYDNKLIPNGSVSFVKYDNTVSSGSQYLYDVLIADVNDDGALDIIKSDFGNSVSTSTGDITYYTKNTNTTSTTFTEIAIVAAAPQRPGNVVVADFTGDGYNDVVYVSAATGDIIGIESTSSGGFNTPVVVENTLGVTYAIAIGKFDGDRSLDIAAAENNNKTINIIINDVVLGIQDYKPSSIRMYPNPTSENLTFEGVNDQHKDFIIFNNLGQKIMESTLRMNNQIDVSNLEMGLYFLKFKSYTGTFKFIKE